MQTALLCNDDACFLTATQVAVTLQPLMTYTHRVVGNEAKCSVPWRDLPANALRRGVSADGTAENWPFAVPTAQTPACFSISYAMDAASCETSFPRGSLLFLQLPTEAGKKQLLEYCSALHSAGFLLGISEYQGESIWEDVLPLVTHIRIQYSRNLMPRQRQLLSSSLRKKVFFVAGNIATQVDLAEAMRDGFQLFQGSFACRVSRLHWPEEEILERVLLLARMCQGAEITSALLGEFLGWTSLLYRFDHLLRQVVPNVQANIQNPEKLFAELGAERTLRYMHISFMWDVTGSFSPVLMRSLFQTVRFHELMRAAALRAACPSACFEGMMFSLLHAVEGGDLVGQRRVENISTLLKDRLGTPMNCSAFLKNYMIARAYSEAQWGDVERRCCVDGYGAAEVNRMFHEAGRWAHAYTRIDG